MKFVRITEADKRAARGSVWRRIKTWFRNRRTDRAIVSPLPRDEATKAIRALRIVRMIEQLTADEGESVEFLSVDPEARRNVVTVDICGAYTQWCSERVEGYTMYDVLIKATKLKRDYRED